MDIDIEFARGGVEAVAQLCEKVFLTSSSFHLGPCGGCGAPSFGQPCAICNFYPYGSDKGIYSPHDATLDHFVSAVDRSGPYGQRGNIATWYLASFRKLSAHNQPSFAARVSEAIKAAADLNLPEPELYWRLASRPFDGEMISRHDSFELSRIWSASDELHHRSSAHAALGKIDPRLYHEAQNAIGAWVDVAHGGDEDDILSAAEDLRRCIQQVASLTRDGNLYAALGGLSAEIDRRRSLDDHNSMLQP